MEFTSKSAVRDYYKSKLASDARWAINGLYVIGKYQTDSEFAHFYTSESNGVGFTQGDASILTSFCNWGRKHDFSSKQMAFLFKAMPKYADQLVNHSMAQGRLVKEGRYYVFTNQVRQLSLADLTKRA